MKEGMMQRRLLQTGTMRTVMRRGRQRVHIVLPMDSYPTLLPSPPILLSHPSIGFDRTLALQHRRQETGPGRRYHILLCPPPLRDKTPTHTTKRDPHHCRTRTTSTSTNPTLRVVLKIKMAV